jgi:hypothetical protein
MVPWRYLLATMLVAVIEIGPADGHPLFIFPGFGAEVEVCLTVGL